MDSQVPTSFIPKKPLDTGMSRRGSSGAATGLFFVLAIFIFIGSIVAAAGVFGYQQYQTTGIASAAESLKQKRAEFDPAVIESLLRIDSRLKNAQLLLQKHVASSGIFNFFSQQTLQDVQFSSFDYVLLDDGSANISLVGQGNSFATVALQSDQFGASKQLKNVVFSDIKVDVGGKITFTVKANVLASIIGYTQNLDTMLTAPVVNIPDTNTPASSTMASSTTH